MPFKILNNQAEVADYAASLDERWPERSEIAAHISRQLACVDRSDGHVVELCCGPGLLAATILREHADVHYTGLDVSAESLKFARSQLSQHTHRARLIQADLNTDGWWDDLTHPVTALVALQSLHDLGAEAEVTRIYRLANDLLEPGGLLINADLLAHTVTEPGTNLGRLTIERHLDLLHQIGFATQKCTLEKAGFGCFVAQKSAEMLAMGSS